MNKKIGFAIGFAACLTIVLLIPSPLQVPHTNDWIGFYGSLLGAIISGVITLVSLLFTLKYYRDKDKKDRIIEEDKKRINLMPYLRVSNKLNDIIDDKFHQITFFILRSMTNGHMMNTRSLKFEIQNIGLGTGVDLEFRKLYMFDDNVDSPNFNLLVGEKEYIELSADFPQEGYGGNVLWLTAFFSDLLENKYRQFISIRIHYKDDEDSTYFEVDSTSPPELVKE